MTAYSIPMKNLTAPSTGLTKAIGPVPADEEWSVDVRIVATGGVAGSFDLKAQNTDGTNAVYRARGHNIDYGAGTFDIEKNLMLTPGMELWVRSGNNDVDVSITGTKRKTS